jgi:hypothetical protein
MPTTLEELSSVAIYILYKVKKQAGSCGGLTNLVALKKGGRAAITDSKEIKNLKGNMRI